MSRFALSFLSLLLLLSFSACDDGSSTSDPEVSEDLTDLNSSGCEGPEDCSGSTPFCHPSGECIECLLDSDCGVSHTCGMDWTCELNSCLDYDSCPSLGMTCDLETGICVGCVDDTDCEPWERCGVEGQCEELDTACTTDSDCDSHSPRCDGEVRQCVACLEDDDCGAGRCSERICVDCLEDTDCASGLCSERVCVECLQDSDCGPEYLCEENQCAPTFTCDHEGHIPIRQTVSDTGNIGIDSIGEDGRNLTLALKYNDGCEIDGPGTYPIFFERSDLDTEIVYGFDSNTRKGFVMTSGTLIIESFESNGRRLRGRLEGMVLREAEVGFTLKVIEGGEVWCISSIDISVGCRSDDECAEIIPHCGVGGTCERE